MTEGMDSGSGFRLEISGHAPADWPDLLARDPAAEYTHTRHWTEAVCANLPRAAAVWLTVRRSGGLVGGLSAVRRFSGRKVLGVPLAFGRLASSFEGTSGGPVIAGELSEADRDRVFGLLVDALASRNPGLFGSSAMVLGADREERFAGLMGGRGSWVRQDAPTAVVSLEGGLDRVNEDKLVMNKRNERNRGLRRGAEVFATDDVALLDEYYRIYEQAAGHWGIEPVPLALLRALLEDDQGRVFFTCVRLEGRVIGGHLNLHYGDRVLAWNGVTDPRFARSHFPATLCFWGDMTEACRRGARWFDMGGSGSVGSLAGFKKYFGAQLRTRGLYVLDAPLGGLLKKGRDRWRRGRGDSAPDRWHDTGRKQGSGEPS